jgi:DNA-binding GntR family transcriptional regulator
MKVKTSSGLHETQRERVYHRIKLGLMAGDYEPGQKLTIAKLAAELGVSATPVREALRRLAAERALLTYPNSSTAVPRPSRATVSEIRAIRERLEGFAAQLAAARIDEKRLEQLARIQEALAAARKRGDRRRIMHLSEEFHFSVYEAAGISVLTDLISTLWLHSAPTLMVLFKPEHISRYPLAAQNRNNLALVRALRRRDGERAARAVRAEIALGSRVLDQLMTEIGWDAGVANLIKSGAMKRTSRKRPLRRPRARY